MDYPHWRKTVGDGRHLERRSGADDKIDASQLAGAFIKVGFLLSSIASTAG
jgi:hypothetical protein